MSKVDNLGKRIKAYRMENQMTQKEMAGFLGLGRRTVIRIELGGACTDLTRAKIEKRLVQAVAA